MFILKCSNNQFYTVSTINIEFRLQQHQNGEGSNFTKKHLPVELVYFEKFQSIKDAFNREKQVQGWSQKKKLALINSNFNLLNSLSECKNDTHFLNKDKPI
jgi:putative endonuclease